MLLFYAYAVGARAAHTENSILSGPDYSKSIVPVHMFQHTAAGTRIVAKETYLHFQTPKLCNKCGTTRFIMCHSLTAAYTHTVRDAQQSRPRCIMPSALHVHVQGCMLRACSARWQPMQHEPAGSCLPVL